jgi:hypothetical protein
MGLASKLLATVLGNGDRHRLYGLGAVALVTVAGATLAFQGWNSRLMNFDYVNFMDAADRLLSEGILPDRGDISSYWAFSPPGVAWLMAPGMLVFDDPRLFEAVGSVSLYAGTLLGVFLLARACFGLGCALVAVILYGLSRNGLFYAGSLYPIGHAFFFVWMIYLSLQWWERNNPWYLAAAVIAWSLGMYVDMVLAPAVFALPAIWLMYRPRIRLPPLLLAAVVTGAVWYPYLKFENTRAYSDLRSLVGRQAAFPANYRSSWCMPTRVVQKLGEAGVVSSAASDPATPQGDDTTQRSLLRAFSASITARIRMWSTALREGLTFNFDQMTWTPRLAVLLLLLGVVTAGFATLEGVLATVSITSIWRWLEWLPRFGWLIAGIAVIINEAVIARLLSVNGTLARSTIVEIRLLQTGLLLAGFACVFGKRRLKDLVRYVMTRLNERESDGFRPRSAFFLLSLVVPWLVLMVVVEQGQFHRYFWLWPLQVVLLVASVTYIPDRLGWRRSIGSVGQVTVALMLLTHPWVISPVRAWAGSGWSGPETNDLRALDYIASQVHSEGKSTVAVGYQVSIVQFMAAMNVVDSRYKVGAELDRFLKYRHGISNVSQCAEGISPTDEYRVVQVARHEVEAGARRVSWSPIGSEVKTRNLDEYFSVPPDPEFVMVGEFGDFRVFRRAGTVKQAALYPMNAPVRSGDPE